MLHGLLLLHFSQCDPTGTTARQNDISIAGWHHFTNNTSAGGNDPGLESLSLWIVQVCLAASRTRYTTRCHLLLLFHRARTAALQGRPADHGDASRGLGQAAMPLWKHRRFRWRHRPGVGARGFDSIAEH